MDQVEKLCDSICLINNGDAVLSGNLREIKSRYERNRVIVEFEGNADFLKSDEIATASNYSGHAEITLKPHGDAQKLLHLAASMAAITVSNWSSLHSRKSSSRPWEAAPMRNMLLVARASTSSRFAAAPSASPPSSSLLFVFLLGVSAFTGRKMGSGKHIAVAADNAALAADIRATLLDDKQAHFTVDTVAPFTPQDRADLLSRLASKSIDGVLIVENSASGTPKVSYLSQSSGDLMETWRLDAAVNHGLLDLRLSQHGLTPQQVQTVVKTVTIDTLLVSGSGQTGKSQGMGPSTPPC